MGNRWNPGCCDCCNRCRDYGDFPEVQWYALFCNLQTINTGYANRVLQPDGYYYYWESNTLGDDLNGLLLNWTFHQSPVEVTETGVEYKIRSREIFIPSLNQTLNVYRHTSYSALESAYEPGPFVFKPVVYVRITDVCGVRYAKATINGVQTTTDVNNPQGAIAKPNSLAPMWTVEQAAPGVVCGTVMEGSSVTPGEFQFTEGDGTTIPHLIGVIDPVAVSLKVQPVDSMLACGSYGYGG